MRDPAPPYVGEGPHALWHVSEDPSIDVFEPHVSATAASRSRASGPSTHATSPSTGSRATAREGRSGRRGTRPQPTRSCSPVRRACTPSRAGWLERIRSARVVAYRAARGHVRASIPTLAATGSAARPSTPLEMTELGDLLSFHADACIELRLVDEPVAALDTRLRTRRSSSAGSVSATPSRRRPLRRAAASSPSPGGAESPRASRVPFAARASRPAPSRAARRACSATARHRAPCRRSPRPTGSRFRRGGRAGGTAPTATGGLASAFASATPYDVGRLLLRATPDDLDVSKLGGHACAGSRTSGAPLRAGERPVRGSRTASGIPGEPPPEPTSITVPAGAVERLGVARSASSTSTRACLGQVVESR